MAYIEYVLLALLGSTGVGAAPGTSAPDPRTLDAGVVSQPRGGAGESALGSILNGQDTGGSTGRTHKGAGSHKISKASIHRRRGHGRHHKTAHKGEWIKAHKGGKTAQ